MLTNEEFIVWCHRLALSQEAQDLITNIRASNPTRQVGGGQRNVSGRYPSRKMGVTIQFESHRVELPFVYEMEHQQEVLEYYDQPPSIPLVYEAAGGRRLAVVHTPDYFVIREVSAGWEECKTEEELERLAIKSPKRYQRDGDGRWRCPPGESHAAEAGLYYSLRSSSEINWILQRNLQFLEDYRRSNLTSSATVLNHVRGLVATEPGLSLDDLFERTKAFASRDDIYLLIADGELYVDLRTEQISAPERTHVFTSAETSAVYCATEPLKETSCAFHITVGQRLSWDGRAWRIVNVGDDLISMLGADRAFTELSRSAFELLVRNGRLSGRSDVGSDWDAEADRLLSAASERDLRIANYRFSLVKGQPDSPASTRTPVARRTLRLWANRYRSAQETHGSGYFGLLPRIAQRGNRNSRLPEASRQMLARFIEEDYESLKQKTRFASWAGLKLECDKRGITVPSYVTFCAAINRRPAFEQTLKRQGRRAAYKHEEFYWELQATTPRHGDRPFEIGHIDHTELDIEVLCSHTGRCLGRPWMTILTDAFSRRCLAVHLTFDPPSYRSCMMILRDCVRKHSRLPQTVVIDGGAEFRSTYFETLLARYECLKKTRPPAKARFGSICERLFGTTNSQFVHNLRGNTQISRNVRNVTKSVNPKGQATWTFGELFDRLEEYLFDIYDTMNHASLGQSPRDAFEAGIRATGTRPQRFIAYDRDFQMATLPTTQKGTSKVVAGRGVKINGIYYWSEAFRNPAVERQNVPVRYDPFDAGTAYAFAEGQWTRCHSEHRMIFQDKSEKEIQLASRQLHRRQQLHAKGSVISVKKLAEFLQSIESDESLLLQRMRDREANVAQQGFHQVSASSAALKPVDDERSEESADDVGEDCAVPSKLYGEF